MVHCMVNNLYLIITGRDTSKEAHWRYDWLFRFILHFVSAILPLLAAMGIANLIYILKYAGLFGFAIALFFPAVLQLTSIYSCNKTFHVYARIPPTEKTPLIIQSEVPIEYSFKFRRMVRKVVYGLGLLEFRKENRESYVTHYSRGFLSHPLFVIVVIFIGFWLFVMACTSIAISPQKLTCDIYLWIMVLWKTDFIMLQVKVHEHHILLATQRSSTDYTAVAIISMLGRYRMHMQRARGMCWSAYSPEVVNYHCF